MGIISAGRHTYGNKTRTQIQVLSGMNQGDTVFNTDRNYSMWYDGSSWVDGNMKSMTSSEGATTAVRGYGIRPTFNTTDRVRINDTASVRTWVGIVYKDIPALGTGPIIYAGIAEYYCGTAVTRGQYALQDGTSNGQFQSSGTTQTGICGLFLESGIANDLKNCLITFAERQ